MKTILLLLAIAAQLEPPIPAPAKSSQPDEQNRTPADPKPAAADGPTKPTIATIKESEPAENDRPHPNAANPENDDHTYSLKSKMKTG